MRLRIGRHRRIEAVLLATAVVAAMIGSNVAVASGPRCRAFNIPVTVPGLMAPQSMYGELCLPGSGPAHTAHLLVTPIASDHLYWNPPFTPASHFSYALALTSAGYATLSIDPIGSAKSSTPPSVFMTVRAYAEQVHQLVTMLRSGALGGRVFNKVVADGWSNGALTAVEEDARFHDVDGLVLAGYAFPPNGPNAATGVGTDIEPAAAEPRFAGRGLDPGYLAFKADFYQRLIVSPDGYDPKVVARMAFFAEPFGNRHVLTVAADLAGSATPATSPSRDVDAPVLAGIGSEDMIFCGTPPNGTDCSSSVAFGGAIRPLFPSAPRFEAFVLPHSGPAMSLALNATEWFAKVVAWSNAVVGQDGRVA